jgi:hypothetical protein
MPTGVSHVRWLASLIGLNPPDEDLEHLATALEEHAHLMLPLLRREQGETSEYPDNDDQW